MKVSTNVLRAMIANNGQVTKRENTYSTNISLRVRTPNRESIEIEVGQGEDDDEKPAFKGTIEIKEREYSIDNAKEVFKFLEKSIPEAPSEEEILALLTVKEEEEEKEPEYKRTPPLESAKRDLKEMMELFESPEYKQMAEAAIKPLLSGLVSLLKK
jgi:hypothetical protein